MGSLTELDPLELAPLLAEGKALLVDVREEYEYSTCHIKDSVLRPMSEFDAATWPSGDGKLVVITCQGGVRSAMVADDLFRAGHTQATHLRGGLNAWLDAGLPVEEP